VANASRAAVRQTERWFVRHGVPCMIVEYGFNRYVLPRILPFLALVAVASLAWLVPVPAGSNGERYVGAAVLGAGVLAGVGLAAFGRRLPRFSRPAAVAVLVAYGIMPLLVPLLALAVRGRDRGGSLLGLAAGSDAAWYGLAVLSFAAGFAALFAAAWLVTTYGLAPLTRRAIGHAVADMRNSVRLQGRALPMLLFATLFFFFTGELWQATNRMAWWRVALVLALFAGVTVLASGVRLREEIGRVEQDLSPARLTAACRDTPLETVSMADVAAGPVPLGKRQAGNLLLMLATRQLVQAAVVGLGLFAFFLVLGLLVVDHHTAERWIGEAPRPSAWVPGVPAALLRNATLIAGFGSMYFAITSMTDSEHRRQFFAPIVDEVERTLAVRAVYLAVRGTSPTIVRQLDPQAGAGPGALSEKVQ
jgi:hypothetical protein